MGYCASDSLPATTELRRRVGAVLVGLRRRAQTDPPRIENQLDGIEAEGKVLYEGT